MPTDINFGIKFEAVITKLDLDRMAQRRGKSYKNCRNAIIGLFGLLLTEAGMYLGVEIMLCNYAITKIFVAGVVLLWNFLARRFLVFM